MAFINELIPEADLIKYDIKAVDRKSGLAKGRDYHWTIDRERDIHLRCVANGRDEYRSRSTWSLHWKGDVLSVELILVSAGGESGGPGWSHWRLQKLGLPPALKLRRSEILVDLEEALTAYKDAGVFSASSNHVVRLEME